MSTDDEQVIVNVSNSVATVTLNRPNQGNSMSAPMLKKLTAAFAKFKTDPSVRVVVLTANGKYFCTGMDLGAGGKEALDPVGAFEPIFTFPKPVVLRMNGPALGGGVGLMFTTDIRVVTKTCSIAFPEVGLGIFPAIISAYIVPQLGPYMTQALMMNAQPFTAERLLSAGVVSEVVDESQLDAATAKVVESLLKQSDNGLAGAKRVCRAMGYGGNFRTDMLQELSGEFRAMVRNPEALFAMKHFKETKKRPEWKEYYAKKKSKL
eukprot:PhF_6_TR39008/c0_g1_i1/m.58381/K13766/liuC; methylglutaconyl-CoA hydratase